MTAIEDTWDVEDEPVHLWFSLSYCNYHVLHRSVLQSAPIEWQRRFVRLMNELDAAVDRSGLDVAAVYEVRVRDENGRYAADPIPHYNRGRTHIELDWEPAA